MASFPQWIAALYAPSGGRDQLGLGSVSSDQILPSLAPEINVLTDHPRYHSFYTFVLDEFWRRDLPRSRDAWVKFFRPREFVFSLCTHLCDRPEHPGTPSAVGSQRTEGLARRELPSYDTTFNYIKSPLGGYGLYYRSVIAGLGWIYPGGPGFPYPVDVPSEKGRELAKAFRREVAETTYYREFFDHDEIEIPIEAVREYARKACLCQLRRDDVIDRALVLDAFLHAGDEEAAAARRETFRMLLDLADQTHDHPLDEDAFRQLIYFRASDAGARWTPREDVSSTALRWRLYQAREYYAFALNALWWHLCDWGVTNGGTLTPLPVDQFLDYTTRSLDFAPLAAALDLPPTSIGADSRLEDVLDWLLASAGTTDAGSFDANCGVEAKVHEHRLYALISRERRAPLAIPAALALLGTIVLRFGGSENRFRPEWEISRMGSSGRLSLDGFLSKMRQLRAADVCAAALTEWLYRDYVIRQHELIALGKLPDNTFRFRWDGGRLRFFNLQNPLEFQSARFGALATTISELGLCAPLPQAGHGLTHDGELLLAEGDIDG